MRQTLFRIHFDYELPVVGIPLFGFGLLLLLWTLFGGLLLYARHREHGLRSAARDPWFWGNAGIWLVVATVLQQLPSQFPGGFIPVFGYGAMLVLACLFSVWDASRRAKKLGFDETILLDLAMWFFFAGIVGARLFYVIQYRDRFFGEKGNLLQVFKLWDGGLVFFGGMISAAAAVILFCRIRKLHPLQWGDILIPAVFGGLVFGRLGCLMNGCCYGDPCDLPWAITFPNNFPKGSVPFMAQVDRGLILPDAPASLALHPTQIYSALNAAVLWAVTATYYRYRPKDGAVLAVGWLLYPLARFTIEILRGDEMYQFTDVVSLTISQWGSVVLFLTGLVFVAFLRTRPMLEAKVLEAETD